MEQRYLVALGSNRRHSRYGCPRAVLRHALIALEGCAGVVEAASPVILTPPLGHTRRRYANSAAIVRTTLTPDELIEMLHRIEADFGRRRRGKPWGDRVLDLDIVLWSGGAWSSPWLTIPHVGFRSRGFVLGPGAAIAPRWRDPITGLSVRQLYARLTRSGRLPIGHTRSGP